jgi:Glycosyl transferase family 2
MNERSTLLSLVVPTEGRLSAVDALVASLLEAWRTYALSGLDPTVTADVLELLIVDSTTPALDPRAIDTWDPSWMHVTPGSRNVRQKRNQGAKQARGAWIAFIDSDCAVVPGYLISVLAAIKRREARAFAGRVEFRGNDNAIWHVIVESGLTTPETQTIGEGDTLWCATANLIIDRCLFEAVGGFDESLPFRLGGDDVDLGLRLHRSGHALRILPDAIVVHPKEAWSSWGAILPRAWRWGRVEYHLSKRHPDRVRSTPPFITGAGLTFGIACSVGALLTGRPALLLLAPFWVVAATVLTTLLTGRNRSISFAVRYMAGCLGLVYHVGAVWEYLRAGSLRFIWEGLILEDQMDKLFPTEPTRSWANLLAALLTGFVGAIILTR